MGSKYSKKCEKMKRQNHYTSFVRINVEKNEYDKEEGEKTKKNNFFSKFWKRKKIFVETLWSTLAYLCLLSQSSSVQQIDAVSQSVSHSAFLFYFVILT